MNYTEICALQICKMGKLMLDEESSLFGSDEDDDERRRDNPEDKKYFFRKEFRTMIYGFGDDKVCLLS
ncbi:unnamed protein product [Brugia timori]|uniref:F-box protein n=1 Tax=Brugia timori TaxID=42155 RepID=A0A0R3QU10_9BILA|nr:unnamed protein product [Brugia timori]